MHDVAMASDAHAAREAEFKTGVVSLKWIVGSGLVAMMVVMAAVEHNGTAITGQPRPGAPILTEASFKGTATGKARHGARAPPPHVGASAGGASGTSGTMPKGVPSTPVPCECMRWGEGGGGQACGNKLKEGGGTCPCPCDGHPYCVLHAQT